MSHALHRHGTTEQLQNDYTFYARASRYVNREGCGPKLRKILSIALEEKNLVNYGSSQAGKSFKAGLKPDEYAATLDKAYGVAGCFSGKESVRSLLKKLKDADTGISIVISGLMLLEHYSILKSVGYGIAYAGVTWFNFEYMLSMGFPKGILGI
ncbi:MAG: hypothetical protein WCK00_04650 [Deltaproteobacteria bacterium]